MSNGNISSSRAAQFLAASGTRITPSGVQQIDPSTGRATQFFGFDTPQGRRTLEILGATPEEQRALIRPAQARFERISRRQLERRERERQVTEEKQKNIEARKAEAASKALESARKSAPKDPITGESVITEEIKNLQRTLVDILQRDQAGRPLFRGGQVGVTTDEQGREIPQFVREEFPGQFQGVTREQFEQFQPRQEIAPTVQRSREERPPTTAAFRKKQNVTIRGLPAQTPPVEEIKVEDNKIFTRDGRPHIKIRIKQQGKEPQIVDVELARIERSERPFQFRTPSVIEAEF